MSPSGSTLQGVVAFCVADLPAPAVGPGQSCHCVVWRDEIAHHVLKIMALQWSLWQHDVPFQGACTKMWQCSIFVKVDITINVPKRQWCKTCATVGALETCNPWQPTMMVAAGSSIAAVSPVGGMTVWPLCGIFQSLSDHVDWFYSWLVWSVGATYVINFQWLGTFTVVHDGFIFVLFFIWGGYEGFYSTCHDILATYFTVHTIIAIMAKAWTIGPRKDM